MTDSRSLMPSVVKELRALLPVWLLGLAAVAAAAAGASADGTLRDLATLLSGAAFVFIGVQSMGHEYTDGTLPWLLSQPGGRARTFMVKSGVLAGMLAALAFVAWIAVPQSSGTLTAIVACALGGLVVAPLLTMLTRSPLAAVVFTFPMPVWVLIAADFLAPEPRGLAAFQVTLLGLAGIAAVASWHVFMRLEALDGPGSPLNLGALYAQRRVEPRRQGPIWLLVKKELGLQQIVFVVSALQLVATPLVKFLERSEDVTIDAAATMLYSGALALLIGALASAEERRFGTHESQLLLPIASSTQWGIKAGVALGLSLLLAFAVPALLILWSGEDFNANPWNAVGLLGLTVVGLYVSSMCSSGLRALLVSLPVTVVVMLPAVWLVSHLGWPPVRSTLLLAGFCTLVLWLASLNHRSADHRARRIAQQVLVMGGCLALAAALMTFI